MMAVAIKEGVAMKICITSEGKNMDAKVDSRFGRCQYFVFFDTDTNTVEIEENGNAQFPGGAGIKSGQVMVSKGVQAVLTGNVGPNAQKVLSGAGIVILTNVSGTIKDVIENYKNGKYAPTEVPSVGSKFGMAGPHQHGT